MKISFFTFQFQLQKEDNSLKTNKSNEIHKEFQTHI